MDFDDLHIIPYVVCVLKRFNDTNALYDPWKPYHIYLGSFSKKQRVPPVASQYPTMNIEALSPQLEISTYRNIRK